MEVNASVQSFKGIHKNKQQIKVFIETLENPTTNMCFWKKHETTCISVNDRKKQTGIQSLLEKALNTHK